MSAQADESTGRPTKPQQVDLADNPEDRGVRAFDSDQLLDGGREVLIRHGSECYRLRHTRNNKLILTK